MAPEREAIVGTTDETGDLGQRFQQADRHGGRVPRVLPDLMEGRIDHVGKVERLRDDAQPALAAPQWRLPEVDSLMARDALPILGVSPGAWGG